jgi:tetratricopeptide (TPR) repeat protein
MPYAVLGGLKNQPSSTVGSADLEESERMLSIAIEKDPKNSTAWLWRGLVYSTVGYFDKALADLDQCLQIDPAYLNCMQHRGRVLLFMGETEAALDVLRHTAYANFHSVDEIFVSALVREGNSLAAVYLASLVLAKYAPYGPAGEWVKALENPGADHSEGLAKFKRWTKENKVNEIQAIPQVLAIMGDFDTATHSGAAMPYVYWDEALRPYRQSKLFKEFAQINGIDVYWRKKGFPPMCRELDDNDYVCD